MDLAANRCSFPLQTAANAFITMMTPRVTNNDIILHDEEFNGQEVEAAALPPPTEMAANRREEADEPDDDETEEPSGRTNRRYRFRFSRNQALAALAALAFVVGTATVVSRAASGKTSSITINSSMQQAAVVPVDVPGYTFIGPGMCRDEDDKAFPFFTYRGPSGHAVATADACAKQCEGCVEDDVAFTFKGFYHSPTYVQGGNCLCLYNDDYPAGTGDVAFDKFKNTGPCKAFSIVDNGGFSSTGEITSFKPTADSYSCYKFVGGGSGKSKASKTPKAAKRG